MALWSHSWLLQLADFTASEDPVIKQIGRDIRRPPVQLPAQSTFGTNFRPGFSGLCPVGTWKSPGVAPPEPLWVACSTAWLSFWRKVFSYCAHQILLPTKFDWMTFSFFNHKKASTEGIRENTGLCEHQLAHEPAEHARARMHRHHQTRSGTA